MKRTWIVTAVAAVFVAVALTANILGLAGIERHQGYLAPVWDRAGKHIYYLERRTYGFVWGLGWQSFSPPASAYALSDSFSLHRLDPASGESEELQVWPASPIAGRVIKRYRGAIFGYAPARLHPGDEGGIEFRLKLSIPERPRGQNFQLTGVWREGRPAAARWQPGGSAAGPSEFTLVNGREVLAIPGREAYPAALVIVEPGGGHTIVKRNARFATLYPDGIPDKVIAGKSRRKTIERSRELRRVRLELEDSFRRRGMSDSEAALAAIDEMEELGYYPKSPRIIATLIEAPPAGLAVFAISEMEFRVGLFSDIAAALARPGAEVHTAMGSYIRHREFDTSARINAWRKAGNTHLVVRRLDRLYLIEYRRFKR